MTPTPPTRAREATRSRPSRLRTYVLAIVSLLAVVAILVLINTFAQRFSRRIDLTATGDMALAPRTTSLLATMQGEHRLIVATDLRNADPRARQHLSDLLGEVEAQSQGNPARFRATLIDTSSATGTRDFERLLADLATRDQAAIEAARAGVLRSASRAGELATSLSNELSGDWRALQPLASDASPPARAFLEQGGHLLRLRSDELRDAAGKSVQQLSAPETSPATPHVLPTDQAARLLLDALDPGARDVRALAQQLRSLMQDSAASPGFLQASQGTLSGLDAWARQAEETLTQLRSLHHPEVTRMARSLTAGQGAILLGPPGGGLVALDLDQLLPSSLWINAAQASRTDIKRRMEELIATALASLRITHRPIVVIAHAEQRAFLEESPVVESLRQRLSMRGIDVLEWAIVAHPTPDFSSIDPQRSRPVVYLTLAPDSAAARPVQGGLSGSERAAKLGQVIATLVEQGANLAVSLNPSVLPTYGEKDPLATGIATRGIDASTGTPLLSRVVAAQGSMTETDRVLQAGVNEQEATHPLVESVRGLPTYLTWCVPLTIGKNTSNFKVTPIYQIPSDAGTWAEGQWLQLRQTPREVRGVMPQQPEFDEGRDTRLPTGERWSVVMASEAIGEGAPSAKPRLVVVGSNDWFIDAVTQQAVRVDGRATLAYPGNLELLESCVWWLAHQDDLIAQSATARSIAIVKPIEAGSLRQVRLALIFGLPALVLVLGALYRVLRGS